MNRFLKWAIVAGVVLIVLGAVGGSFFGAAELTRPQPAQAAPADGGWLRVPAASGEGTVEVPVSKDVGEAFERLKAERDDARRKLAELKEAAGEYEKARAKLSEMTK